MRTHSETQQTKTLSEPYPGWLNSRFASIVLLAQPLFAAPVFFSVLIGKPPLWLSWTLAIIPMTLRFWREKRFAARTPFDIPILIFVAGLLVGLLVSPVKTISLEAIQTYFACILIYYGLVSNSCARGSYWLLVAGTICLITLVLSAWFFSEGIQRQLPFNEWAFRLAQPLPRITGPVFNLHSLAALLAVVVSVLFAVALFKGKKPVRMVALVLGAVCATLLALLASGSGWISAAIGLTLLLFLWHMWTLSISLPALGLGSWLVVANYNTYPWLASVFSVESFMLRVGYWLETFSLLRNSPITGCGLGAWLTLYRNNFGVDSAAINPHNSYLQLYTDTGILGGVALVFAAIVCLRLSRRMLLSSGEDPWYGVGIGSIAGIVTWATDAMVEVTTSGTIAGPETYKYIGIPLVWILAAVFVVAYERLSGFSSNAPSTTGNTGLPMANKLK